MKLVHCNKQILITMTYLIQVIKTKGCDIAHHFCFLSS